MRGRKSIVVLAVLASLGAAGPAAGAPPDGLDRALRHGDLTRAGYALERALALFQPQRARALWGTVASPGPREGTVILRDLAAQMRALEGGERRAAERILARPTDRRDAIHGYRTAARRSCDPRLCFWWVTRTSDAPSLRDGNRNRLPDWVDRTRNIFRQVWAAEIGRFGYRRPRSDLRSRNDGGNRKLDVYIADVGRQGLYGYCTTDEPGHHRRRAVSAYCVVDDDFARRQFDGSASGLRALKVTAAHEFFHAIQFNYDWLEDLWLMEGTATWMEDEVFDGVNDNLQYLRTSPIAPTFFYNPLDYYNPDPSEFDAGYKYGVWIFWRYLSERFGRDVVREVWQRAGSRTYSLGALVTTLSGRGVALADLLTDFGVANFYPESVYSEGGSYPSPRPSDVRQIGAAGLAPTPYTMYHLSNDYLALIPDALPPTANLRITLDLPVPESSPRATALVERADGTVLPVPATLEGTTGRWVIDVPEFGSTSRVVLMLTSASTRYRCWRRMVYSCRGAPIDRTTYFFYEASVS
jgi:hypothetical protein